MAGQREPLTYPGNQNIKVLDFATGDPYARSRSHEVALSKDAVAIKAEKLRESLESGFFSGDGQSVIDSLRMLKDADRCAVIASYEGSKPGSFMQDVRRRLGAGDAATVESIVNHRAGQGAANLVSSIDLALTLATTDNKRANDLIRSTLSTLNREQIDELKRSYSDSHHKSLPAALKENENVSSDIKSALPVLEKGIDHRSAQDVRQLADLAIKYHNLQMFSEVIGGSSPECLQVRSALQDELKNPKSAFARAFKELTEPSFVLTHDKVGVQPVPPEWNPKLATDLLREGRISLATITEENTGRLFGNKDNISLVLQNASPEERQKYLQGKQESEKTKVSKADMAKLPEDSPLRFYSELHGKLANAGDKSEVTAWEDQLLHGSKTAISDLVDAQTDHFFIHKTHSPKDLFKAAENISSDDWKQLKQHKSADDPYWSELRNSLKTYASEPEQRAIVDLLQRKANADSFVDSQSVHRSASDTIDQSFHHVGRAGTKVLDDAGRLNVIDALSSMSAPDAERYKSDTTYKADIDRAVKHLDAEQQRYARALLQQVESTGKPPSINAELQLLSDKIHNVSPSEAVHHIQEAMHDTELRQRLKQQDNQLTSSDKHLKQVIREQVDSALGDGSFKTLLDRGTIPVGTLIKSGLPITSDTYREIAATTAGSVDRDSALKALSGNPDQLAIALNAIHQSGQLSAADVARSFAIGDKVSLDELKAQWTNIDVNQLRNEYVQKYGQGSNDLDSNLLKVAAPEDVEAVKNLLQSKSDDANHRLFEHVLNTDTTGIAADGTRHTLDRASQDLREGVGRANKNHIELSPAEMEKLNTYCTKATEQYQESKRALADAVAQTTITAGSLAAIPFTGGLSLGAIGVIAAAGGTVDATTHAVIEGQQYGAASALKDLAGGTAMTASMFAGGELAAKVLGVGKEVANVASQNVVKAAEHVTTREGTVLLSPDKQTELSQAMEKLLQEKLGSGRDALNRADLQKLARQFANHPESAEDVNALANLMQASLGEQVGSRLSQAVESLRLQGIGFGSGGTAMGLSEVDLRKPLSENLTRVAETAAISTVASVVPAAGSLLKREAAGEGKVLTGGVNELAESNEKHAIADAGDVQKSGQQAGHRLENAQLALTPELKIYSDLADRAGLSAQKKQQFLERLADFQKSHPGFQAQESPAIARLDDRTLAEQVRLAAMENSVAAFHMATKDYSNEIMNRAGMEAYLHSLERAGQLGNAEAILLNLKNFKAANDTFDHQTGDVVLHAMSKYLHSAGFDGSLPVKLQGDAFVLIGPKGQAEQVEKALSSLKIYATEDGVALSGQAGGKPLTMTIDKNGRIKESSEAFQPPSGKNVVVTAFKDREVSTMAEDGKVLSVSDVLNNIYGSGPKPATPEVTVHGIGAQAQHSGSADRGMAEAARAKLNSTGSVSDSIMDMVDAGALRAGQLTRDDLVAMNAILQAEENEAAAAYMLERGTGLIAKEHYEYTLASQTANNDVSAVIVADVKGFGSLNGLSYFNRNALGGGRLVGDAGIEVMSDALREAVQRANLPEDIASQVTLARIGGDEIGVILPRGISDADREKVVNQIDSIRLAVSVQSVDEAGNATKIAIRKYEPGESLKTGELDVGVASGIATIEKARAEQQLRQDLHKHLVDKDLAGARRVLNDSDTKYGLPPSRLEAISTELDNAAKKPDQILQPLDRILQSQGDKASEHIKKLEKEFLVLNSEQTGIARDIMSKLQAKDLSGAQEALAHADVPEGVRRSLETVLATVRHGEITPGQGAFVLGDRITYSQAHPEYVGKEIKLARFGTQEVTNGYETLSRRELADYPKQIVQNGQPKTINVAAFEYTGDYINAAGHAEHGVVAVISEDGKTVVGGYLKNLLDEAVRLHKSGAYEQSQKLLREADQLYARVGYNADQQARTTSTSLH